MGGRNLKELSKIEGKESGDHYVDFVVMPDDAVPTRVLVAYDESSKADHPAAIAKHPTLGYAVIQMGTNGAFVAWKDEIRDHVAPQPAPKNDPEAKPLWPVIIAEAEQRIDQLKRVGSAATNARVMAERLMVADMQARHEFGVAKYGVPLVAKNERDHLSDAYQEFLDAGVYLRAEIERCGGVKRTITTTRLNAIERMYSQTIQNAIELRGLIYERDGR